MVCGVVWPSWSLIVAGCYEQPSERCAIRCSGSAADACPSSLTCNTQGYCVGSAGDLCTASLATVRLGAYHGCGLDTGGALYCWGDDTSGAVGLGNADWAVIAPTRVGNGTWTALAAGGDHTCAIRGGEVYCWGQNQDGESRGTAGGIVTSPFKVSVSPTTMLPASGFQQVAAGGGFSCAIGEGQLWCWGRKDVIGIGVTYMERVGTLGDWVEIEAGNEHLCGISASQGLLCWGSNDRSQAGQPNQPNPAVPTAPTNGLPAGMVPVHVAAGMDFTCVILGTAAGATSGSLWCWGENGNSEVDDSSNNPVTNAVQIGTAADWTTITAGTRRACGIHGGHAFCWGDSSEGGLGNGVWNDREPPITAADLGPADDVVLGVPTRNTLYDDVACVIASGQIRCWGGNEHGELGIGTPPTLEPTPVTVASPNGHAWKHVRAGHHHSCGQTDDGALWCWGDDGDGRDHGHARRGHERPPVRARWAVRRRAADRPADGAGRDHHGRQLLLVRAAGGHDEVLGQQRSRRARRRQRRQPAHRPGAGRRALDDADGRRSRELRLHRREQALLLGLSVQQPDRADAVCNRPTVTCCRRWST